MIWIRLIATQDSSHNYTLLYTYLVYASLCTYLYVYVQTFYLCASKAATSLSLPTCYCLPRGCGYARLVWYSGVSRIPHSLASGLAIYVGLPTWNTKLHVSRNRSITVIFRAVNFEDFAIFRCHRKYCPPPQKKCLPGHNFLGKSVPPGHIFLVNCVCPKENVSPLGLRPNMLAKYNATVQ